MNSKHIQFAKGSLRIQASKYAEAANEFFNKACSTHKEFEYFEEAYDIMKRYMSRYSVWLFSVIYIFLLVTDTLGSSNLIRPIASEILGSTSSFTYFLAACIYSVVIFVLTLGASKHLFMSAEKNIKLNIELESHQYPHKAITVIEAEIRDSVKGSWKKALGWIIVLLFLTVSLALYRNYIVNDHQLFVFDTPDDWIILILPLSFAAALIYFGQYKSVIQKYWAFSRKMNQKDRKRKELKAKSYVEAHKAEELNTLAQNRNESSAMTEELRICLERLASVAYTNPSFFDITQLYSVLITILRQGIAVPNCPIQSTTADGKVLYHVTDTNGSAMVQWKSEYNYLQNIRIHNVPIHGDKFEADEPITIDLDNLLGNTSHLTPPNTLPPAHGTSYTIHTTRNTDMA